MKTCGCGAPPCCISSSGKKDCDQERLFGFCLLTMDEKDFFIRKAIGWALRQHARIAPEEVSRFPGGAP